MHQVYANERQIVAARCGAPKARMVAIGERRLALTSSGEGTPTVVLETGLGAESGEWVEVYQGVASLTRVCRHDRAGREASQPARGPRDALRMVEDLHELLHVGGLPGPYILVGHSLGGLLARLYAHRYGESVASLVLVDSMHEDQFDAFGPLFPPATPSDAPSLRSARAFWTGGWRDPSATVERIDFLSNTAQARDIASLGSIPVHVITTGVFLNHAAVPQEHRTALQERWEHLQQRFPKLSSRATYSVTRSSGHFIQRDNLRVVLAVIRAAIAQARCAPGVPAVGG